MSFAPLFRMWLNSRGGDSGIYPALPAISEHFDFTVPVQGSVDPGPSYVQNLTNVVTPLQFQVDSDAYIQPYTFSFESES